MSNLFENQIFITKAQQKIYYDYVKGKDVFIVFLSGLNSDRKSTKATYLKNYARENSYSFLAFDYLGHGDSDMEFTDCDINIWLSNIEEILNNLVPQKAILIGSSLGGWLAIRLAEKKHTKISAIIGLAAAPDFTENLIWDKLDEDKKQLLQAGKIYHLPNDYCDANYQITYKLIESGRQNLLLNKGEINIDIPIRLLQGMADTDVPYNYAIILAAKITSKNLNLQLIKNADHRLSDEYSKEKIKENLEDIIKFI